MWPSPRRAPRDCEAGMSEMTGWLLVWPILLPVLASALAVVAWGRERTQTLIGLMGRDKKVRNGTMHFVLPRRIGDSFVCDSVTVEALQHVLEAGE